MIGLLSYSEGKDGAVILTMSREDYERLLMRLGTAAGFLSRDGSFSHEQWVDEMSFLNRVPELR